LLLVELFAVVEFAVVEVDELEANNLFPSLFPQALSPKLPALLEKEVAPEVAVDEVATSGTLSLDPSDQLLWLLLSAEVKFSFTSIGGVAFC